MFVILVFGGLYFAKPFLIPVAFAALFAMLLLPLSEKLENRTGKIPSILISIFVLILGGAILIALLSWQVSGLFSDFSSLKQQGLSLMHKIQDRLNASLGISLEEQKEIIRNQSDKSSGMGTILTGLFGSVLGFITNVILVMVYIFLFLYTRSRLKNFILLLVPQSQREEALRMIRSGRLVAQKYLSGLAWMIICLWVLYSIGFSIAGLENPVFFAVLCGTLEIVPFVGNLTGSALAAIMALVQGGGVPVMTGVIITYFSVQFFQSYVLEPLVVGSHVNINPLFTIMAIVIGELVWGIAGMILAIPYFGIFKIICDHAEPLKPYGYLIGSEQKGRNDKRTEKLKRIFKRDKE